MTSISTYEAKRSNSHQFYFEAEGKWLSLFYCGKLVAHNGISDKLITAGLSGIEGCSTFMHIAVCKRCTIHSIFGVEELGENHE